MPNPSSRKLRILISIFLIAVMTGTLYFSNRIVEKFHPTMMKNTSASATNESEQKTILIAWNDLGKKMADTGVIDAAKMEKIYQQRGGLTQEQKKILSGNAGTIEMNEKNAPFMLNMLWGFGLANKNEILEKGPMSDPEYGGADRFASTGGWSLGKGDPMDHYSKYKWITLNPEQQKLVEEVSKNIYRPCCGNSVYFPDCNHGMAMLGMLEILAANGTNEQQLYRAALIANSYWFPETYQNIEKYFKEKKGIEWKNVDPKEALGKDYSSGSGYQKVVSEIEPEKSQGGGSCSV